MRVGDKLWTNWNKAPLKLWQTQLNYVVFCASSVCEVSLANLNYTKHPMIRPVYHFHVYYHMRRVLKRLQTRLPHETALTIAPELEIVWILAGATAGTRLESGWFLAASTKTFE